VVQGRFHYTDSLRPDDFSQHPGSAGVYAIRARLSAKKESAPSNVVAVPIEPLPEAIGNLKAEVTHSGIQLTWTPPARTPVGPAPSALSYRIYRAVSQTGPEAPANGQASAPAPRSASRAAASASNPATPLLAQISEVPTPGYLDTRAQFGNAYTYSVRSVIPSQALNVPANPPPGNAALRESADSNLVTLAARDVFPPAAPQGLVAVFVPAQGGEPAHLELSWGISPETDLAGYNVYRSEQANVQAPRLNPELLLTPAFQDTSAAPGRTYFYRVTAVDRSGNESDASAAVEGTIPAESQSP
jgi:hypothetical protein